MAIRYQKYYNISKAAPNFQDKLGAPVVSNVILSSSHKSSHDMANTKYFNDQTQKLIDRQESL